MIPPVASDFRNERYSDKSNISGVHACRYTYTNSGLNNSAFEWNAVNILDNHSLIGENCAIYNQANVYNKGSSWASCFEVCDMTFGTKYGNMVAGEFDVWCVGPDREQRRIGAHIVVGDSKRIRTGVSSPYSEASMGILVSNNGVDNARWVDGVRLQHFWQSGLRLEGSANKSDPAHRGVWFSGGSFVVGFDFSGATFQSPIRLGAGQFISLEGTDSVKVGYENDRVKILMNGKPIFEVDIHSGDLYLKGGVKKL